MDPNYSVATKEDIWQIQNEMKTIHAVQAEYNERLMKLERRHEDDIRIKSVWGNPSPFANSSTGHIQQEAPLNPAAEAFRHFDQDQSGSLLGGMPLENEETRRGVSRANSVRFDESALGIGHFGHASHTSSEYFPTRSGSAFGSHPMTERSSSHKSDGRHSSAGQSASSFRLNSIGLESRQNSNSGTNTFESLFEPPPGLFLLGPVPAIIRCWLSTNFSNESLLYAAVCTGSYKSHLSVQLVHKLGLQPLVQKPKRNTVRATVHLPEATVQKPAAHNVGDEHQLPYLSVDFEPFECRSQETSIQIILGSDILRAKNADILFSQGKLSLSDENHNRISLPLVRPERTETFEHLMTLNSVGPTKLHHPAPGGIVAGENRLELDTRDDSRSARSIKFSEAVSSPADQVSPTDYASRESSFAAHTDRPIDVSGDRSASNPGKSSVRSRTGSVSSKRASFEIKRDQKQAQTPSFSSVASNPASALPSKGKSLKILKSSKSDSSKTKGGTQESRASEGENESRDEAVLLEQEGKHEPKGSSQEQSRSLKKSGGKSPKSSKGGSNPVGGASAFGWLNPPPRPSPPAEDS